MRGKLQIILAIVILMINILGNAIVDTKTVNASASYGDRFIIVAELLDEDGNLATTVDQYATTQAHYEFKIPDDQIINAGDTMTIKLPSQLIMTGALGFDIQNKQGNVIAHALVNQVIGEVTITFTDFFETHQTNKQGRFNIWTVWDHDQINTDTDVPLDWGSQGISTVHIGSDDNSIEPNEKLSKWGNIDPDDLSIVHWTARVNYKREMIKNAVATDTIGPNQKLITSSVDAKYVMYGIGNNYTVTGLVTRDKINVLTNQSFEMNFGDLNETVLIFYDTQTTNNGASATYSNNIQLKGDKMKTTIVDANTPDTGGGGAGSGDNQAVILTKKAADNAQLLLADAHFRLETKAGQVIKPDVVSDASGQLKVIGLPVGQYQFVEIKAPTGYQLDSTPVSFEIVANQNSAVTVTKIDQPILGSVTLTKKDSQDSTVLKGATFELQDSQGNQLQSNLITGDNGQLTVNSLTLGNYQLVETQAPTGYQLDQKPAKFTISQNQTKVNVIMTNKLTPGGVVLTKQDSQDGSTLQGAVFELQDAKGKELRNGLTTDTSGQLAVKDLIPGDYAFVETKAPTGYELDERPVKFTIKKGQTNAVKVVKTDKLIPGGVVLTKQDSQDGSTLQGAVFALQNAKGKELRNGLTTDTSGQLAVKDLIPGDYAFVETKAPTGYELDEKPVKFTIKKGQTNAVKVVKTDKLTPGGVVLTKQDSQDGSTLQGAVFKIVDARQRVIQAKLTSNQAGQIIVTNLAPGHYSFIETKAPAGYVLDQTPVRFTVKTQQQAVQRRKENR